MSAFVGVPNGGSNASGKAIYRTSPNGSADAILVASDAILVRQNGLQKTWLFIEPVVGMDWLSDSELVVCTSNGVVLLLPTQPPPSAAVTLGKRKEGSGSSQPNDQQSSVVSELTSAEFAIATLPTTSEPFQRCVVSAVDTFIVLTENTETFLLTRLSDSWQLVRFPELPASPSNSAILTSQIIRPKASDTKQRPYDSGRFQLDSALYQLLFCDANPAPLDMTVLQGYSCGVVRYWRISLSAIQSRRWKEVIVDTDILLDLGEPVSDFAVSSSPVQSSPDSASRQDFLTIASKSGKLLCVSTSPPLSSSSSSSSSSSVSRPQLSSLPASADLTIAVSDAVQIHEFRLSHEIELASLSSDDVFTDSLSSLEPAQRFSCSGLLAIDGTNQFVVIWKGSPFLCTLTPTPYNPSAPSSSGPKDTQLKSTDSLKPTLTLARLSPEEPLPGLLPSAVALSGGSKPGELRVLMSDGWLLSADLETWKSSAANSSSAPSVLGPRASENQKCLQRMTRISERQAELKEYSRRQTRDLSILRIALELRDSFSIPPPSVPDNPSATSQFPTNNAGLLCDVSSRLYPRTASQITSDPFNPSAKRTYCAETRYDLELSISVSPIVSSTGSGPLMHFGSTNLLVQVSVPTGAPPASAVEVELSSEARGLSHTLYSFSFPVPAGDKPRIKGGVAAALLNNDDDLCLFPSAGITESALVPLLCLPLEPITVSVAIAYDLSTLTNSLCESYPLPSVSLWNKQLSLFEMLPAGLTKPLPLKPSAYSPLTLGSTGPFGQGWLCDLLQRLNESSGRGATQSAPSQSLTGTLMAPSTSAAGVTEVALKTGADTAPPEEISMLLALPFAAVDILLALQTINLIPENLNSDSIEINAFLIDQAFGFSALSFTKELVRYILAARDNFGEESKAVDPVDVTFNAAAQSIDDTGSVTLTFPLTQQLTSSNLPTSPEAQLTFSVIRRANPVVSATSANRGSNAPKSAQGESKDSASAAAQSTEFLAMPILRVSCRCNSVSHRSTIFTAFRRLIRSFLLCSAPESAQENSAGSDGHNESTQEDAFYADQLLNHARMYAPIWQDHLSNLDTFRDKLSELSAHAQSLQLHLDAIKAMNRQVGLPTSGLTAAHISELMSPLSSATLFLYRQLRLNGFDAMLW